MAPAPRVDHRRDIGCGLRGGRPPRDADLAIRRNWGAGAGRPIAARGSRRGAPSAKGPVTLAVTDAPPLDARGRRLRAALAAVLVRENAPELRLMHQWLDTWAGLGLVVAGMTHQGWDVQLTA